MSKKEITNIPSQHFRTTNEMLEDFSFLDKELAYKIVVENTNKILDMAEEIEVIKKDLEENRDDIIEAPNNESDRISDDNEFYRNEKDVIEQSKLNKEERQKNIQGVYELRNKEKLYKKKILLVDDIYTTGSTVNECSKVLKGAKPKQIGIFTIAKD